MSFLLHCNRCFALPESQPQFYYTSCGHILCKMCVQNMSSDSCPVCGVARILKLDLMSNSPQAKELRTYFSDPFTVLEHGMTKAKFLQKFQNTQLQSIIRLIKVPYHEVAELNREKDLLDYKIKVACEEQIGLQNEHDEALSALQKSCKKSGNASNSRANGFRSLAHDNVLDMLTCNDIAGNQLLLGTTTVQDNVQPMMSNIPVAFQSHQIAKRGYSSDTTDSLNGRFRPVERAATTPSGSQKRRSRRDQEGGASLVTDRGPVHYAKGRLSVNHIKSPTSGTPSNRSPVTGFCSHSEMLQRQQQAGNIILSPLPRTPSPASSISPFRPSPSNNQNPQIRSNVIANESTGFRLSQSNSSARASREYTVPHGNSAESLIRSAWSPQPSAFVGTSTNSGPQFGRGEVGMTVRLNLNRPQQSNQNTLQQSRRVSSDSISWTGSGHGRFGQSPLPTSKLNSMYF